MYILYQDIYIYMYIICIHYITCIAEITCVYFHVLANPAPVACGTLESPDSIQTGSCTGPNLSLLPRFEQQSSAKDQPDWKVRDRTFHPPRVFQVWDKKMSMPETFTDLPHKAPRFSWQKPTEVFTSFRLSVAGWHKDHKGIGNPSSFNVLIASYCVIWLNHGQFVSHAFGDWEVLPTVEL